MCGDGCNDCGALKTAHAGRREDFMRKRRPCFFAVVLGLVT